MNQPFKYLLLFPLIFWIAGVYAQVDSMRLEAQSLEGKEKVDYLFDMVYYFPKDTREEAEAALKLARELKYLEGEAGALDMLGEHYAFIEDYEKSKTYRQQAADLYFELNDIESAFSTLTLVTYLDIEQQRYFDALRNGIKLTDIAESLEDSLYLADAYYVMSRIYDEGMLHLDRSMQYLHQSKMIYEQDSQYIALVGVYNDLGAGYETAEKFDSAAIYYGKGLSLARKLYKNDPYFDGSDLVLLLTNSASIENQQGNLDKALNLALEALEKYEENPYTYYLPTILFNVASVHFELGDLPKAKEYLKEAEELAEEMNSSLDLVEIYRLFKKINQQEGNFEEAFNYQESYQIVSDSVYNGERAANLEWVQAQYNLAKIERENELLNNQIRLIFIIVFLLLLGLSLTLFFYRKLKLQKDIIQHQNERLDKLNKTQNRLFAIIGHDFKTPLINFQNLASKVAYLLKKNQPERVKEMGKMIDENVMRLRRQMDNVLNWAMSEMGRMPYHPVQFELNTLATDGLISFSNLATEKGITVLWNVDEKLSVFADKQAIELVVRNILSNALKFTCKGGMIKFSALKKKGWVELIIEDNGVGIPSDKLANIFVLEEKKSSRGTKGEKGTGLGLVVCKELMELNRGEIYIESEEGKGTKVFLKIPTS
jgi:signal transduction histidine kinase